jgi:hypothetical protein
MRLATNPLIKNYDNKFTKLTTEQTSSNLGMVIAEYVGGEDIEMAGFYCSYTLVWSTL